MNLINDTFINLTKLHKYYHTSIPTNHITIDLYLGTIFNGQKTSLSFNNFSAQFSSRLHVLRGKKSQKEILYAPTGIPNYVRHDLKKKKSDKEKKET